MKSGVGHGAKTTTYIYIDYDMERVKMANRMVIDYVLYPDRFKDKYDNFIALQNRIFETMIL